MSSVVPAVNGSRVHDGSIDGPDRPRDKKGVNRIGTDHFEGRTEVPPGITADSHTSDRPLS